MRCTGFSAGRHVSHVAKQPDHIPCGDVDQARRDRLLRVVVLWPQKSPGYGTRLFNPEAIRVTAERVCVG